MIVPGPDNNYDRRVDPAGEGSDAGIPQAIYLENVIPTANGYQSAGYSIVSPIPTTGSISIYEIDAIRTAGFPVKVTLAYKNTAGFYASSAEGLGNWTSIIFSGTTEYPIKNLSSAVVRGVCYVLIQGASNSELFTAVHNDINLTLTNVTASVTPGSFLVDAKYICAAYNYLICLKDDGIVYWSSTTTPTDFVSSLVTGAGSEIPNSTLSRIRTIFSTTTGFYIESTNGLTYAQYTGNSRYPWKFVPVDATNTIVSYTSGDVNSDNHYVLESSGAIKNVTQRVSEIIAPELSDYLRRIEKVDVFDSASNTFSKVPITILTAPKIYLFFDRYICLSCEAITAGKYSAIIIYDISLKRYGKLKIVHTNLVHYNSFNNNINAEKIGIVDKVTGVCSILDFDVNSLTAVHAGVLVLGKYQYVRSRFLALDEIALEGDMPSITTAILPSLDGKNFDSPVLPTAVISGPSLRTFVCRTEAKNQTLVIKGAFSLDTVELVFHPGAGR